MKNRDGSLYFFLVITTLILGAFLIFLISRGFNSLQEKSMFSSLSVYSDSGELIEKYEGAIELVSRSKTYIIIKINGERIVIYSDNLIMK